MTAWSFETAEYKVGIVDKVQGYPVWLMGAAKQTDDMGGRTGAAGDRALDAGTGAGAGGGFVPNASFLNAATADDSLTIAFFQKLRSVRAGSSVWAKSLSSSNGKLFHEGLGDPLKTDFATLFMGGGPSPTDNRMDGLLDDFVIYNGALTEAQAAALAGGAAPSSIQSLIAHWDFDTLPSSAPSLSATRTATGLTITFTGRLQSADQVQGPYTDVAGATSPASFFVSRLRQRTPHAINRTAMSDPADHYRGEAGQRYHEVKRGLPAAALPWMSRVRAEKLQPFIRAEDVVFEYGVGAGWNLAGLRCARRIGLDVSDFLRAEVEGHGIEFVTESRPLPAACVDALIGHHALEHLLEPVAALVEMRRLLKPDGRLLLWVPFEDERRHRRFERGEKNHHLFSWNPQTLGNLVEECGFRVEQAGLGRYGWDRFAAAWAVRLRVGERGFRLLRRLLVTLRPLREVRILAKPGPR